MISYVNILTYQNGVYIVEGECNLKRSLIRKLSLAILTLTLLVGVASCSVKSSQNSSSSLNSNTQPVPSGNALEPENGINLRVAFFPNITHPQALVGQEQGTFNDAIGEGNTIEWTQFNAGPAEVEALFAGEIDIGYIGPGPAINAYVKSGGEFQVIAGATDGGAILVSREGLVISDLKELSGLKIAVPQFGNTQDLSLRNILLENGLSDTTKGGTVEIVAAQNADILSLMQSGEIDAALIPEPWGSRLIHEAGANLVLDFNEIWRDGDYATTVLIASKDFIEEHPWMIKQFLKAHVELTDYMISNPDEAKTMINHQLQKLTGKSLTKEILDSAFRRLVITTDPSKESVEAFSRLSYETGFISRNPDLSDLFSFDSLNQLLEQKIQ